MHVLITGATGSIMSNVARRILEDFAQARLVLLDINVAGPLIRDYLRDHSGRIEFLGADVSDRVQLAEALDGRRLTHVLHGAAVTHDSDAEREDPARFIEVNLNGTLALLEWIRRHADLVRYVHVSTGGVYGDPSDLSPTQPQPETGPFDPPELYAVSKYAAELVVRRYGQLFAVPEARVRFADVFGPMERPTGARRASSMSVVYRMMRATIENRPLRVTERTRRARIDLTSAEDIARALALLLSAEPLGYDVYNVSAGRGVLLAEVFETFASIEPNFAVEQRDPPHAEVDFDPANNRARYNVYDTTRIRETGWRPRALVEQLAGYRSWVLEDPETRCPQLSGRSQTPLQGLKP